MAEGTIKPSSTHKALGTVEILGLILECVSDVKSLAACVHVCQAWEAVATPILWRGSIDSRDTPNVWQLETLAQRPDRFNYYLKYMRYINLHFGRNDDGLQRIWDPKLWRNARYRCLKFIRPSDILSESRAEILLHENLLAVLLFGGVYSDQFLETLKKTCPNLRWLYMEHYSNMITSSGFLRALQSLTGLQGLDIVHGFEIIINEPILLQITNLDKLEHLSLSKCDKITPRILQASDHKLRNLCSLELRSVDDIGLQSLISQLPNLQRLDLVLEEVSPTLCLWDHIFLPLSKCSNLVILSIFLAQPGNVSSDVLDALGKSCPGLRVFVFSSPDEHELREAFDAPYTQFVRDIAHNFRFLEEVSYNKPCSLTRPDLSILSKSCPLLRSLSLKATLDMNTFHDAAADLCLPRLETLRVRDATIALAPREEDSGLVKLPRIDNLLESMLKCLPSLLEFFSADYNFNLDIKKLMFQINRGRANKNFRPRPSFKLQFTRSLRERAISR